MSPIETVAKAIFAADVEENEGWENCHPSLQNCYIISARAALTALRDCGVTEGMWKAYMMADTGENLSETCEMGFRAMLDAALEGE